MEPQHSVIALREDDVIRHDNDSLLAHDNSHAVDNPNFAPISKLSVEILAEIFVQCLIPSGQCDRLYPIKYKPEGHPQKIRERLGQVCRRWNTIIDNEPRIWSTLVLCDKFLDPEMVSLWIKKSQSHPLDVFYCSNLSEKRRTQRAILTMLRKELWRIRVLHGEIFKEHIGYLFPLGISEAPMMQIFMLSDIYPSSDILASGGLHCPQLHSLSIRYLKTINLFVKPMENVHQLAMTCLSDPIQLYLQILDVLPNLVSLTWCDCLHKPKFKGLQVFSANLPPSLRSLTLQCCATMVPSYLTCFFKSTDANVSLRSLTLDGAIPTEEMIYPLLPRLKHLTTLVLSHVDQRRSVDTLLLALSPLDRDRNLACPQLKTVQLRDVGFSTSVLEGFVERRVKSDLDDPAPDLVTSLVLDDIEEELHAKFAQTYSSSISWNTTEPSTRMCRCCVGFTQ